MIKKNGAKEKKSACLRNCGIKRGTHSQPGFGRGTLISIPPAQDVLVLAIITQGFFDAIAWAWSKRTLNIEPSFAVRIYDDGSSGGIVLLAEADEMRGSDTV
jgi:hypothetical protein